MSFILRQIQEFFAYDPEKDQWFDQPVPQEKRLGFWKPTSVWIGFGIAYVCAFIGAQIYMGLGMPHAIYAIALGNAILVLYSSFIAVASSKGGLNFPMQVQEAFGRAGAWIPILIMSLLVNGWYAYQAWLAADVIRAAWNPNWYATAIIVTVVFGLPAVIGIEEMSDLVTKLVLPLMILASVYMVFYRIIPAGWDVLNQPPPGDPIPFMLGVGMAWSTFAVSGTATGDIVRFTKNPRQAVGATVVAFLLCNTGMMVLGALAAAAAKQLDLYFGMIGVAGSVPLVVIATMSCWSTCDACLYGATMGYSNLSEKITWRVGAIIGVAIATIAAVTGVISNLVSWLILIGLLVPPIGGIIIADFYVLRREKGYDYTRRVSNHWSAILSLIAGTLIGYYTYVWYPQVLFGSTGLIACLILYPLLSRLFAGWFGEENSGAVLIPRSPAAGGKGSG